GLLAWWASDDFQPRVQRIIRFDELKFRRAPAKQVREQALEMSVDHLKCRQQPVASLPVEVLYSLAQLADRLDHVLALGNDCLEAFGQLPLFFFRTQIDGAEALSFD